MWIRIKPCSAGNLEGMKQLEEQGVDVDDADEEGRTGLHFSCGYGEIECVKWFLEKGAKLDTADTNKNTALHYAAGYGQVEVVALLLEKYGMPCSCQCILLHLGLCFCTVFFCST